MRELVRIAAVSAWLAIVWAAAPLAQVRGVNLAVAVPLVVLAVGVALIALERLGGGLVGIVLTVMAVWMFAAATWGLVGGTVLLVSGLTVLASGHAKIQ
ncbi:hypothetical protein [Nonomuraea basaltis]|uniref:hypothetical protein n=1 Tax=Nonomuraea basaltis TaxID=2495887 RepID=UPI00110C6FE2|nr:hypothetical protein [Nonomuraea basaltis]TMR92117.1 hypothetical protein EJK15_46365 [Nonomuraea basaltis]